MSPKMATTTNMIRLRGKYVKELKMAPVHETYTIQENSSRDDTFHRIQWKII